MTVKVPSDWILLAFFQFMVDGLPGLRIVAPATIVTGNPTEAEAAQVHFALLTVTNAQGRERFTLAILVNVEITPESAQQLKKVSS